MNYTPFYQSHLASNGKVVDFGGWALAVNYGSQIREHQVVRESAGMFDVSHMLISDVHGVDAKAFMRYLISNDVNKLDKFGVGKALYSGMLNQEAGILDDLIVYLMPFGYRLVTNASTEAKDMNWIKQVATGFKIELFNRRDLAMLAIQGPRAIEKVAAAHPAVAEQLVSLKPFMAVEHSGYFYARTGYTGENGLEVMLPREEANQFWNVLVACGVEPCGLGARDTLRLEAGMNLYGHDMDESVTPLVCNMDWVVDLSDDSRDFIGKRAYQLLKLSADNDKQVGLLLEGKGVLREGQKLYIDGNECGNITSGTFSPSLKVSIAIARVKASVTEKAMVDIRGNLETVKVINLPFVRNGQKKYK